MIIRKPGRVDAQTMYEAFLKAQVSRHDFEKPNPPKTGFYEYALPEAEFFRRASSGLSLIAEQEGRVIGYMVAFEPSAAHHADAAIREVISKYPSSIYFDQLYLAPNQPVYVAGRLFDAWKFRAQKEGVRLVTGAIPEQPWTNESSRRFLNMHGFRRTAILPEKNIALGLYIKPFIKIS